jgi:hypothetical protein
MPLSSGGTYILGQIEGASPYLRTTAPTQAGSSPRNVVFSVKTAQTHANCANLLVRTQFPSGLLYDYPSCQAEYSQMLMKTWEGSGRKRRYITEFSWRDWETSDRSKSRQLVSRPKFEPSTTWIWVHMAIATITRFAWGTEKPRKRLLIARLYGVMCHIKKKGNRPWSTIGLSWYSFLLRHVVG